MSRTNRLLALALVSCTAFGSSAYALDRKVMPGSACQPIQAVLVTDISRRGRLINAQGKDIGIDCPVVRDNNATLSSTVLAQVRVNGHGKRVECDLSSYDRSGNVLDFDRADTTATFPVNLTLTISNAVSRGAYSISCSLPHLGELINYTVSEITPTDDNN